MLSGYSWGGLSEAFSASSEPSVKDLEVWMQLSCLNLRPVGKDSLVEERREVD